MPKSPKKMTRSHTSAIEKVEQLLPTLQKSPFVTKISLGIIKHIGVGKPAIKFHLITGGFKMVVRGNISVQEVFVYTGSVDEVQKLAQRTFSD
jgi:hypothetical protein